MHYEVQVVNSFTGERAEGNPAGVVICSEELPAFIMQEIASQVGFSETAFLYPIPLKKSEYQIRWFTTVVEVPLCGHGTLAAAALLFKEGLIKSKVVFQSLSGELRVLREGHRFILDFPVDHPREFIPSEKLLTAMSIQSYISSVWGELTGYLLIQMQDEKSVANLYPNYPLLKAINPAEVTGLTITAQSDNPQYDFVSRFFDPWAGIMEDPVTGSAHTLLGPYWQNILGKKQMIARQISSRGGILYLEMRDNRRIYIGGNAEFKGKKIISIV